MVSPTAWKASGVIWLASIFVTAFTIHFYVAVSRPEYNTHDGQWPVVFVMWAGVGLIAGVLPAALAALLIGKKSRFKKFAYGMTVMYGATLFLLTGGIEAVRTGKLITLTLIFGVAFPLVLVGSPLGALLALAKPSLLLLGFLALMPFMAVLVVMYLLTPTDKK